MADPLPLTEAKAEVDWESFVRLADGSQFPQSSRADLVARMTA
jgi:hypothetical protein